MSGGVDSAVAAARLVDQGHEVVGVHLALSRMPGTLRTGSRGCCTIEDSMDAQRAAKKLGIPFYVWDFSERFKIDVVDDFVAEYQAGRTPNPCMRCNERIKFAALLERALALGFDAVGTGHYASITKDEDDNLELQVTGDGKGSELCPWSPHSGTAFPRPLSTWSNRLQGPCSQGGGGEGPNRRQ